MKVRSHSPRKEKTAFYFLFFFFSDLLLTKDLLSQHTRSLTTLSDNREWHKHKTHKHSLFFDTHWQTKQKDTEIKQTKKKTSGVPDEPIDILREFVIISSIITEEQHTIGKTETKLYITIVVRSH
jgi:hypothetical protein